MQTYIVTTRHDHGTRRLKVTARNEEAARAMVTAAEHCPDCAIIRVKGPKPTTGSRYDNEATANLASLINTARQTPQDREQLFRALHNRWEAYIIENPFYKRTPAVFKSNTIFFVQLHNAFLLVYPDLQSSEILLQWIYNHLVFLSPAIGPALDVSASEAGRILKAQNKYLFKPKN